MTCRRRTPQSACRGRQDVGLLLLRTGVGAVLAAHGAQKLFGWFGGGGLEGTGAWFESVGYRPGRTNALLAGAAEVGGGALLALGLATPVAGAAAAGAMAGAAPVHAPNGFFNQSGGFEYPAVLGLAAAALAVTGPGRLSADHALGDVLNRPWMAPAALLATAAGTAAVLTARARALRETPPPA
ncbi:DoxX family membrane protein [Streptomyces sp. CC224B]|uniref:DoxX family membrane protein n=1 Tax=Streptomyces sp. CC224B TaxID=3044571 RepID=UPI0024A91C82|nr:DoxX family membrane protein [Streptomyces sp. CC224B]